MYMKDLTLKAPAENVVCLSHLYQISLPNESVVVNSVDPDQTAPIGQSDLSLHCLTKRLLKHFRIRQKQTTFVVIGTLRVK